MAHSANSNSDTVPDNVVTLEQDDDDVWWFIGPDGDQFVSLGVNHIEPHLWLGSYNEPETLERHGEDFTTMYGTFNPYGDAAEDWIENIVDDVSELGFNSFGRHVQAGIPHQYYANDIYYVAPMNTAPIASWKQVQENAFKKFGPFPDPFSDAFERDISHRVEQVCKKHRSEENLLGYFYADLPWWQLRPDEQRDYDENTFIYPWATAIVQMDATAAGKQRWLEVLRDGYDSAKEVAAVYDVDADSWDELARHTDWFDPADDESVRADLLELMQGVAERWYGLHEEYIRQYDEKHLILGDKQNFIPEWLFPFLEEYVDVTLIQKYEPFEAHHAKAERLYEETGNPIINGDGSFSVVRDEQSEAGSKGYHFDTEEEVGEAYRRYVRKSLEQPYMLGWHHCGVLEQWDDSERGDIETSETGFLDPYENEYTAITDRIEEANRMANQWHADATDGGVSDD
ncbi:beta-agarase [Halomicroarcula limicola]|uniref:Beta-agarase n=1 Tax=Haloarcula limicola TaxID=1429915 RepID=A0A8J7Y896_9EURY|nr:beta-agarase [Halomicroarcula limicola]MBV0926420.1 beta-agarase [Halomicroarcula limicola]